MKKYAWVVDNTYHFAADCQHIKSEKWGEHT